MPTTDTVIIGGGFAGLSAAYEIAKRGISVTLIEKDSTLGGIAGSFEVSPGIFLEKFYHHWFSSDQHILDWIEELGARDLVKTNPTTTTFRTKEAEYSLSAPLDLLRFKPLPFWDRLRTAWLVILARNTKNWRALEQYSAKEWIIKNAGQASYREIWKPLLAGKFGDYADKVSAVWMWSRLSQRGSSRDRKGNEHLVYFDGGFGRLIDIAREKLVDMGVSISTGEAAKEIVIKDNKVHGVETETRFISSDTVLCTTPLPVFTSLVPAYPKALLAS